ncbi:hypothetical protein LINGRAHAP2_LOCUS31475, partial [Linum grandiflorum]
LFSIHHSLTSHSDKLPSSFTKKKNFLFTTPLFLFRSSLPLPPMTSIQRVLLLLLRQSLYRPSSPFSTPSPRTSTAPPQPTLDTKRTPLPLSKATSLRKHQFGSDCDFEK